MTKRVYYPHVSTHAPLAAMVGCDKHNTCCWALCRCNNNVVIKARVYSEHPDFGCHGLEEEKDFTGAQYKEALAWAKKEAKHLAREFSGTYEERQ